MFLRRTVCALLLSFGVAFPAEAEELARFHQAVSAATAPLREAIVRLQENNAGVAHLKLREALGAWRSGVLPFAGRAIDPLSDDPAFGELLEEIAVRLQKAEALTANGEQASAQQEVEPILPALAALRARNGLWSFEDCLQRAHEAIAALWQLREEPVTAGSWPEVGGLAYLSAVAHDRYRLCRADAPATAAGGEELERLFGAVTSGLVRLRQAIAAENAAEVPALLGEIRDLDRLVWMRFG